MPTLAGQGLPGYEVTLWFGMWAPSDTAAVVQKLNAAVNAIVFEPPVRRAVHQARHPARADEARGIRGFVRSEIEMYRKIVRQETFQLRRVPDPGTRRGR